MTLTYTIWSNAGRHEFIIRCGDTIIHRSGLIFTSRSRAKQKMIGFINQTPLVDWVEA
jgi:hypothetical protein